MLLLLPVIVLLGVGALLALGLLGGDRAGRPPGMGGGPVVAVALAGVVGLGVVVALLAGVLGRSRSDGPGPPEEERATPTVPERARATGGPAPALPAITVDLQPADRVGALRVLDGVPDGGVVVVLARGFESFEVGRIELCASRAGQAPRCGSSFPVQFSERGRAALQYLLSGAAAPGGCRASQPTCLLRVTGRSSARSGAVQVVLVDRPRRAEVRVTPTTGLRDGQPVEVRVRGLRAGSHATALFCAPPGVADASRCTTPGASFTVAADGTGSASLPVVTSGTGHGSAACGPRRGCAVVVLSGNGFLASSPVPVRYSLGPGPDYEPTRLAVGLVIALLLLVVATVLLRTTDWARPTEAATPDQDSADLQADSDLDDLFGTDAELEAASPSPF